MHTSDVTLRVLLFEQAVTVTVLISFAVGVKPVTVEESTMLPEVSSVLMRKVPVYLVIPGLIMPLVIVNLTATGTNVLLSKALEIVIILFDESYVKVPDEPMLDKAVYLSELKLTDTSVGCVIYILPYANRSCYGMKLKVYAADSRIL